jgi:hypothetical protein
VTTGRLSRTIFKSWLAWTMKRKRLRHICQLSLAKMASKCSTYAFLIWSHYARSRAYNAQLLEQVTSKGQLKRISAVFHIWLTFVTKRKAKKQSAAYSSAHLKQYSLNRSLGSWRQVTRDTRYFGILSVFAIAHSQKFTLAYILKRWQSYAAGRMSNRKVRVS